MFSLFFIFSYTNLYSYRLLMRRFVCLHFEYHNWAYMRTQKLAWANQLQHTKKKKKTNPRFNSHATSRCLKCLLGTFCENCK